MDIYSFDQKINHIARHVRLPEAPLLGPGALSGPREEQIPPVLIINVQLPMYSVRLSSHLTCTVAVIRRLCKSSARVHAADSPHLASIPSHSVAQ